MHGADDAPVRSQGRVCVFTATGSLINSWRGTRKARLFAAAGADRRRIWQQPSTSRSCRRVDGARSSRRRAGPVETMKCFSFPFQSVLSPDL